LNYWPEQSALTCPWPLMACDSTLIPISSPDKELTSEVSKSTSGSEQDGGRNQLELKLKICLLFCVRGGTWCVWKWGHWLRTFEEGCLGICLDLSGIKRRLEKTAHWVASCIVLRDNYSCDSQIKGDEMDFACGTKKGEKKFLLGLVIIFFFFQTLLGFTT